MKPLVQRSPFASSVTVLLCITTVPLLTAAACRCTRVQVLPISFFERANNAFFNSVVVFDADGERLGLYRKSHIPDGPGYQASFCGAQVHLVPLTVNKRARGMDDLLFL